MPADEIVKLTLLNFTTKIVLEFFWRSCSMFYRTNQHLFAHSSWALLLAKVKKERGTREEGASAGEKGGRRKLQINLPNFCMTQPHHYTILMVHELALRRTSSACA